MSVSVKLMSLTSGDALVMFSETVSGTSTHSDKRCHSVHVQWKNHTKHLQGLGKAQLQMRTSLLWSVRRSAAPKAADP
eukprot:464877-Amphidinium_carterae.1